MNFRQSLKKAQMNFGQMIPMLVGVLLLANLLNAVLQKYYEVLFTGSYWKDTVVGALAGSFSFGIPLTSYIIGGEFIKNGISLLAVTAFIMTWSSVGILMLPLEMEMLGKKFAIYRNILNFFLAIVIAILTVIILNFTK